MRLTTLFATVLSAALAGCVVQGSAPGAAPTPTDATIASVFDGSRGQWVDLTHPFSANSVYWPTDVQGFELEELAHGHTEGGWFYASYRYSGAEHGGTHLDAPLHFGEGRHANHEIPLDRLVGPAVVVDVADRADADYQLSVADLARWEAGHGRIPDGAIVLVRTGWDARYGDRAAYLGTALTGPGAVPELRFPGIGEDAARWLVEARAVDAVGIDTASIDHGQSPDFRSHVVLAGANVPGFENLAGLDALPATGAFVVALPMKIQGGSGGPLRIVAYLP